MITPCGKRFILPILHEPAVVSLFNLRPDKGFSSFDPFDAEVEGGVKKEEEWQQTDDLDEELPF